MPNQDTTVESQVQPTVTAERTVNNELDSFRKSMGLSVSSHDTQSEVQDNEPVQSEPAQETIDSNDEPLNQEPVNEETGTAEPADESSTNESNQNDEDLKTQLQQLKREFKLKEQELAMQRKIVEQQLSLKIPEAKQQNKQEDVSEPVSEDFDFTPDELVLLESGDTLTAIKKALSRVKKESANTAEERTIQKLLTISEQTKKQESEKQRWNSLAQKFATTYPDISKDEFSPILSAATNDIIRENQEDFMSNPELYFSQIADRTKEYISKIRGVSPKTTPPPAVISGNNSRKQAPAIKEVTPWELELKRFREALSR